MLYVHRGKSIAVNEEVLEDAIKELGINKDELEKVKSAEVGNIFNFGTVKAEQMGISYTAEDGSRQPIYLASYGIGITRVMGVIVEKFSDEKGLVWPENIAPFKVIICRLGDDSAVIESADKLYEYLESQGIEVLYDDREARPGEKFADADLLGIPCRVVISAKTVKEGKLEYKMRTESDARMIAEEDLLKLLAVGK